MNYSIPFTSITITPDCQNTDNLNEKVTQSKIQHNFDSQQTYSGSKINRKYIKMVANSQKKPLPYYKKIKLQNYMSSSNSQFKMNEPSIRNNPMRLCECIEGFGLCEKIDFGMTQNKRKVSLQKKKQITRHNTPVNQLTELISKDPYPTHYLHSNKKR